MDGAAILSGGIQIRRVLRPGDVDGIVELHRDVYATEHGMQPAFWAGVKGTLEDALARGWPDRGGGGAWLIDGERGLAGALGLTDEGDGRGHVRWFVLRPELRGHGLGRTMLAELLAQARDAGMCDLSLETFSALRAAARLYRDAGFRVVWEREIDDWGPSIVYQHYELRLR